MTTPELPVLVERWKRYGHDRVYVKIEGTQVGYRDLKSGAVVCEGGDHRGLIERATEHLMPPVAVSMPSTAPPTDRDYEPRHALVQPACPSALTLLPDRDLALNPPGQSARRWAREERDAAPVRTFIARVAGLKTDERAKRIGADAEVEVGRRLTRLDARWRTLHAIPIGDKGSDIDHLVIGPAGVFTLNTKHHPDANVWVRGDTVKVNGQNQHYVRNSRHEAARSARLLSAQAGFEVDVRGLIVVMGAARGFTVKEQPADGRVTVVARKQLIAHLGSLPAVLGQPTLDRIHHVARHLATWQPKTVGWSEF